MPLLNAVIDISHFNNVTSFQDVRNAGIIGVINKATQGLTGVDGTYGTRKPQDSSGAVTTSASTPTRRSRPTTS